MGEVDLKQQELDGIFKLEDKKSEGLYLLQPKGFFQILCKVQLV